MNRIVLAAVMAALVYAAPMRADDKSEKTAEKPKDRQAQLRELQSDFQKKLPEVVNEFRNAKSKEDREKVLAKLDPLREKGYKLVEQNPSDDVSFETLTFLMGTAPEPPQKTIDLLAEHQINNPKMAEIILSVAGNSSAAATKLTKAAEKSTNKSVRGAVTLGQANKKVEECDEARGNDVAKSAADAESMLVKVAKEYGDAPISGTTIGKIADKGLFFVRNLLVGKAAPEVVGHDLDGKADKLSDYKGKVVVLDIWATWCGPCKAMIPHEREMVEKLKDKPFVLISISADDEKATLQKFLEKEQMPWKHWWEGPGETGLVGKWNVRFFPTIYVIDSKGVIRFKHVREKELENAVTKLLEEMEKK
jgi:thiol-disulfide isomerase/thioredoxin